jgi:hypothetical protein
VKRFIIRARLRLQSTQKIQKTVVDLFLVFDHISPNIRFKLVKVRYTISL